MQLMAPLLLQVLQRPEVSAHVVTVRPHLQSEDLVAPVKEASPIASGLVALIRMHGVMSVRVSESLRFTSTTIHIPEAMLPLRAAPLLLLLLVLGGGGGGAAGWHAVGVAPTRMPKFSGVNRKNFIITASAAAAASCVAAPTCLAAEIGAGGGSRGDIFQREIKKGMALFQEGRVRDSIEAFDALIAYEPRLSPYLWQRGISLYYANEFTEASSQFRGDIAVNPNVRRRSLYNLYFQFGPQSLSEDFFTFLHYCHLFLLHNRTQRKQFGRWLLRLACMEIYPRPGQKCAPP